MPTSFTFSVDWIILVALVPFIKVPTPPGIPGRITAAASTTMPTPSRKAPPMFPSLTLSMKEVTPVPKENKSHAVSIVSSVGSVYLIGLLPRSYRWPSPP